MTFPGSAEMGSGEVFSYTKEGMHWVSRQQVGRRRSHMHEAERKKTKECCCPSNQASCHYLPKFFVLRQMCRCF